MNIPQLFDRPIAYHRIFVPFAGVNGAVMLSQALYWTNRTENKEGWFFKTQEEWTEETGLTRSEQEGARKKLVHAGVWEEKLSGVPARKFYRVNTLSLTSLLKTCNPVCGKPANKNAENLQTIYTETTTETTEDIDSSKSLAKKTDFTLDEDWPKFVRVINEWNQSYGTRYKYTESIYKMFVHWLKTYDLLDILCAVKMIKHDDFWHDKMTPTILFRQRNPKGDTCDRIGDLMNIRGLQVQSDTTLTYYNMLKKWFDEGKKPENLQEVIIPLQSWGFTEELNEAVRVLKERKTQDANK